MRRLKLLCLVLLLTATPASASVLTEAANHLTAIGVPTVVPEVVSGDCLRPLGWDGMCMWRDGRLMVAFATAPAVAATEAAFNNRTIPQCSADCEAVMFVYLHELVHLDRFAVQPQESWDPLWEEGLADAIAYDQLAPLQWRISKWHGDTVEGGYTRGAAIVRWTSARAVRGSWRGAAARRWRLNQISQRR